MSSNDPHSDYDFTPNTVYDKRYKGCVLCETDQFDAGYVRARIEQAHYRKYDGPDYASLRAELREDCDIEVTETELEEHHIWHVRHRLSRGKDGN